MGLNLSIGITFRNFTNIVNEGGGLCICRYKSS